MLSKEKKKRNVSHMIVLILYIFTIGIIIVLQIIQVTIHNIIIKIFNIYT